MANVAKRPLYSIMEGIRYPSMFSPKCFGESLHYKPRDDDVLIVTYPKCGTTWMQNIALYIFRKGEELSDHHEFVFRCPFLDMLGQQGADRMPRPGTLKTHLPYSHMPYSQQAKYIFVVRNPKDCCVSLYHHARMLPGFGYWDGIFDDFFELFMAGEVEFNDYFDHLLSWFPHRNDPNVFYTTYEDMKKDTESIIIRLANFLGKEYGQLVERDNNVLRNILHFSSFTYMKENIAEVFDSILWKDTIEKEGIEGLQYLTRFVASQEVPKSRPKVEFVRKGKVGDWKEHFSSEQSERLQKKFDEKFQGTDIPSLWTPDILF